MPTPTFQTFRQCPDVESVNYYRPGGFHPVHLNDRFNDGRYQIVHKLGYGAYATVWLVRDAISTRYASLKVLAAEVSNTSEIQVLEHLQKRRHGSGKAYIVDILDHFEHSGPNGTHQCIVTEVLGPPISSDIEDIYPSSQFPIDVAKRISAQIAHGIAYLHRAGIVHGDLHLGNILLHCPSIASWSSHSDVEKYLGAPFQGKLVLYDDSNDPPAPSPHIPSYIVPTSNPAPLLELCLSDPSQVHIKLCDFSESFIPRAQSNAHLLNTPTVYAAPEVLFRDVIGPPVDVWALAVMMHVLISGGIHLFPSYHGIRKEVLRSMVLALGNLPERWWTRWDERAEYFDEQGKWIGDNKSLSSVSRTLIKFRGRLSKEEFVGFEQMMRKMVEYEPGSRATMEEVIQRIPVGWLG